MFDAHDRAFAFFKGACTRGIYDNMKTAVDRIRKGKARDINTRFQAMVSHYLFEAEFCNRAAGWEKGRVEKNVQDRRRHIWREAADWPLKPQATPYYLQEGGQLTLSPPARSEGSTEFLADPKAAAK